jgi:hypothetical protein
MILGVSIVLSDISGSHGGEYEDDCLLGCCAVWSGRSLLTFQRCFCLHHQGDDGHRPDDGGSKHV